MFPFWGTLRNISAKNAYSQRDVQNLQKWAMQNDLIVIPLVQTFGHMEFVLKLDEFKDLREVPIYPQSICPSQDRSWTIIQEMTDQVSACIPKYKERSSERVNYDQFLPRNGLFGSLQRF